MRIFLLVLLGSLAGAEAQDDAASIEFFEKNIRPVLVDRCYSCHSATAPKLKGGLRLDTLELARKGGDSGPALVPGHPEKSPLIEAVTYKNVDLRMPPKGKLPEQQIADLTAWVRRGAAWPKGASATGPSRPTEFNLEQRKAEHWSWKPLHRAEPPPVKNTPAVRGPVDRFLLAKLEEKGLEPAASADPRTLLRRLSFDLVGLPPSAEDVEGFVADPSDAAYAKIVDRLLSSPQYGETWGRHWLDLMRYAETRGHEYDYTLPNAHHYRNYVIRAFNADLPYPQLVLEHVAGDLLPEPRLNPTSRFNESVIATGWWYLGEWLHSPVDTRIDEMDRVSNQIEVFGKTFLGLTISCARCHDHKFDAISQKDFYALAGFLKSSNYRQVRFDTIEDEKRAGRELEDLREKSERPVVEAALRAARAGLDRVTDYLEAARDALSVCTGCAEDIVFEDFESGTYRNWTVEGTAFGKAPQTAETIAPYQGKINAGGRYFVNSHNIRQGEDMAGGDRHTGRLTSRQFRIERDYVSFLVGGGAFEGKTCVNLIIDGKVVATATGRNSNMMAPHRWDVRAWRDRQGRIEIVDEATGGWGNIGVDDIVFTDGTMSSPGREKIASIAEARKLDPAKLTAWVEHLSRAVLDPGELFHAYAAVAKGEPAAGVLAREQARVEKAARALDAVDLIADFTKPGPVEWTQDGVDWRRLGAGDAGWGAESLAEILPYGALRADPVWRFLRPAPKTQEESSHRNWMDSGRLARTATFTLTKPTIFSLVRGAGHAFVEMDAHRQVNGPLHASTIASWKDPGLRWVAQSMRHYVSPDPSKPLHRAHVEYSPDSPDFEVLMLAQGEAEPGNPFDRAPGFVLDALRDAGSPRALAEGYARKLRDCGDWLLRHPELTGVAAPELAEYAAARAKIAARVNAESRLTPGILAGPGADEYLLIRGNGATPKEIVPRRFLEAFGGGGGRDRLDLARRMIDPQVTPLVPRVLVNRVWHHLFGRGLVPTVDDFGRMGQPPVHGDLLDFLALRFVGEGGSIKNLIRELVLSSAYRRSSVASSRALEVDPGNALLQHREPRRISAEAVRDAMLAVSGRLDLTPPENPVPIHLDGFQDGRGRPADGPVDGGGKRSVYLAVHRNFISSMLLAFDFPQPFSAIGRRSVSNVPAQALILRNNPFVHELASFWATRLAADAGPAERTIDGMFRAAFARPASSEEISDALALLKDVAALKHLETRSPEVWKELAHALFQAKEFFFVR
jgi:hypothetical protein